MKERTTAAMDSTACSPPPKWRRCSGSAPRPSAVGADQGRCPSTAPSAATTATGSRTSTPSSASTRRQPSVAKALAALIAALALLTSACGGGGSKNTAKPAVVPTTATTAAPTTTTSVDAKVIADYLAFWDAFDRAQEKADPDDPELPAHT